MPRFISVNLLRKLLKIRIVEITPADDNPDVDKIF